MTTALTNTPKGKPMSYSEKYDVAHHAAITWMAKNGLTVDPRFSYADKLAYADELALKLVMGEGTPRNNINGMTLEHSTFGWYVDFHNQFEPRR